MDCSDLAGIIFDDGRHFFIFFDRGGEYILEPVRDRCDPAGFYCQVENAQHQRMFPCLDDDCIAYHDLLHRLGMRMSADDYIDAFDCARQCHVCVIPDMRKDDDEVYLVP